MALTVALRDAHFRMKNIVREWEESAPAGVALRRNSIGPAWQYEESPNSSSYIDGHVLELANGVEIICQISIRFDTAGTDLLASISIEGEEDVFLEPVTTGPNEFPVGSEDLVREIGNAVSEMEGIDIFSIDF
ncbi:hypothetical protein ACFQ2M_42515 [Kitasatospora saccharophila]|uniref:hypothetical protein n=1 Tax=Kitasatospora saccharophila TaxID=407973 RepID=UPI003633D56F